MSVAVVITPPESSGAMDSVLAQTVRAQETVFAETRNLGIAQTTAPLILVLDGEDRLEPTWIATASELLAQREDLSFACCAVQVPKLCTAPRAPAPCTIAEALGRGACDYRSAVFRRELWEQVGGFDEALGGSEEVDFWLRASMLGFRGAILAEQWVRRRRDRTCDPRARERLLAKHMHAAARHGEEVLAAMLEFQQELLTSQATVVDQRHRLEHEVIRTREELSEVRAALELQGIAGFEPGTLEPAGDGGIEQQLMDRALDELAPPARRPRRTLALRPGDRWPQGTGPAYDLVIVAGALEHHADPVAALAACRRVLRTGGRLIVLATTISTGDSRRRGFSYASLRAMLGDLFDAREVTVVGYGNVLTSIASVLGAPLPPEQRAADDPANPTVVAGCAQVPRPVSAGRPAPQPPLDRSGRRRRSGAILAYGRIAPDAFAAQMAMLAGHYKPISLHELAAQVLATDVSPGAIAVTLDECDPELVSIASELGIPLTIFADPSDELEPGAARIGARGLTVSRDELERLAGAPVDALAYTGPTPSLATTQLAEQAGYTVACTIEPGAVTGDSDPLRLPRVLVATEDVRTLELCLEQTLAGGR